MNTQYSVFYNLLSLTGKTSSVSWLGRSNLAGHIPFFPLSSIRSDSQARLHLQPVISNISYQLVHQWFQIDTWNDAPMLFGVMHMFPLATMSNHLMISGADELTDTIGIYDWSKTRTINSAVSNGITTTTKRIKASLYAGIILFAILYDSVIKYIRHLWNRY